MCCVLKTVREDRCEAGRDQFCIKDWQWCKGSPTECISLQLLSAATVVAGDEIKREARSTLVTAERWMRGALMRPPPYLLSSQNLYGTCVTCSVEHPLFFKSTSTVPAKPKCCIQPVQRWQFSCGSPSFALIIFAE